MFKVIHVRVSAIIGDNEVSKFECREMQKVFCKIGTKAYSMVNINGILMANSRLDLSTPGFFTHGYKTRTTTNCYTHSSQNMEKKPLQLQLEILPTARLKTNNAI